MDTKATSETEIVQTTEPKIVMDVQNIAKSLPLVHVPDSLSLASSIQQEKAAPRAYRLFLWLGIIAPTLWEPVRYEAWLAQLLIQQLFQPVEG